MVTPYDLIRCSWPRPVSQKDGRWISKPEWDAPLMPASPQPQWHGHRGESYWTVDWCDWFRRGSSLANPRVSGQLPGFHVVFELRVSTSGRLKFWADNGCVIRRNGEIAHCDRVAHPVCPAELEVRAGDRLQVAQWHQDGRWVWGAKQLSSPDLLADAADMLAPYLKQIQQRLQTPTGPAIKMYCQGSGVVRTVLSLYSMILNGYAPSDVYVYGVHQWSESSRRFFEVLLPFARFVPTEEVVDRIEALGQPQLLEWALRHWHVLKMCVSLCCPPSEFCWMDDDVFILDAVDDAMSAFRRANFVFSPDFDQYGTSYLDVWGEAFGAAGLLRTGNLNAGLYWLRNRHDPERLAATAVRVSPEGLLFHHWEQGFMACQFAHEEVYSLSPQRYLFPVLTGFPGGVLGYDYASNPCGFASVHFAGIAEKPSNAASLLIARDLLGCTPARVRRAGRRAARGHGVAASPLV